MNTVVTIDFESFYGKNVTLKKLSVEEYLFHPEFRVHGMALQLDAGPTEWVEPEDIGTRLHEIWPEPGKGPALLAHNVRFDGSIAAWLYGVTPSLYLCSMGMARASLRHVTAKGSVSLAACAEALGLPPKGGFITNMYGRHPEDLSPAELQQYRQYATHDAWLAYQVFSRLVDDMPLSEIIRCDLVTRMYTHPQLLLDRSKLEAAVEDELKRREEAVRRSGQTLTALRSRKAFVAALASEGVTAPTKISPITDKPTHALAATDYAFTQLLHHPNEKVRNLVGAKLAVSSNIELTRAERLLERAKVSPWLCVPLLYYGTHTGRLAGDEKINLQNLRRDSPLRAAFVAPEGFVVVIADLSQIEARLSAWWAGEIALVSWFSSGADTYAEFAKGLYGIPDLTKETHPNERFVGKVAILSMQYGVAAERAAHMLRAAGAIPPNLSWKATHAFAVQVVSKYQARFEHIVRAWSVCSYELTKMVRRQPPHYLRAPNKEMQHVVEHDRISLPNGLYLHYPDMRRDLEKGIVYRDGKAIKKIYGSKLFNHLIQSMASIITTEHATLLASYVRPAMQVHDSWAWVVREEDADWVVRLIKNVMTTSPSWAPNLPLDVEVKVERTYG